MKNNCNKESFLRKRCLKNFVSKVDLEKRKDFLIYKHRFSALKITETIWNQNYNEFENVLSLQLIFFWKSTDKKNFETFFHWTSYYINSAIMFAIFLIPRLLQYCKIIAIENFCSFQNRFTSICSWKNELKKNIWMHAINEKHGISGLGRNH